MMSEIEFTFKLAGEMRRTSKSVFGEDQIFSVESVGDHEDRHYGIAWKIPGEIAPVFNTSKLYKNYTDRDDITAIAIEALKVFKEFYSRMNGDGDCDADYSKDREHLVLAVKQMTEQEKARIPHRDFHDLSVYCRVHVSNPSYFMIVTNSLLKKYGITEEQLFDDVMKIEPKVNPMTLKGVLQTLDENSGKDIVVHRKKESLFVLRNETVTFGAGALFYPGVIDQLYDKFGSFYLLPSSVHEVLITPVNKFDPEMVSHLITIVRNVNQTQVEKQDFLSNSVYFFDGNTRESQMFKKDED